MAGARRRRRGQKTNTLRLVIAAIVVLVTSPFLWGTWAILFLMGAPTLVAYFVDRSERRHLFSSVLAVNVVGILPSLSDLWLSAQFYDPVVVADILTNVWYYLIAYGISAVGWGLFRYVPRIIGEHMAQQARRRVERLRARQEALVAEWGSKVKAGAPSEEGDAAEMLDAALGGAEPIGLESSVESDLAIPEQGDHLSEGLAQQRAL